MILTDKALKDFNLFLSDKYGKFKVTEFQTTASAPIYECFLDEIDLPNILLNELIIEFFDSKGINIGVHKWGLNFWLSSIYNPFYNSLGCGFNTRQEATKQAIIKANEIYNNE